MKSSTVSVIDSYSLILQIELRAIIVYCSPYTEVENGKQGFLSLRGQPGDQKPFFLNPTSISCIGTSLS